MIESFFSYFFMGFSGYFIGRVGHFFAGHSIDFLHHWIYGLLFTILGFFNFMYNQYVLLFGIFLFLSDFKDFSMFKIYGRDNHENKKFWGFD